MEITPVQIWKNGTVQTATQLICISINDNLDNSATFYYQLLDIDNIQLADGNTVMDGVDYENWDNATDINLAAYQWNAQKLGLTLI